MITLVSLHVPSEGSKMSSLKTICVKWEWSTGTYVTEHVIDTTIFDNPFVEACTQVITTTKKSFVKASIICWDKDNPTNCRFVNTYKILLNASRMKDAENLRAKFMKRYQIDMANEPLEEAPHSMVHPR